MNQKRSEKGAEEVQYNENCWMNYKSDIMWIVNYEPHSASLFDGIYNLNSCQFKRMAVGHMYWYCDNFEGTMGQSYEEFGGLELHGLILIVGQNRATWR
jgi:hypothetical protein